MKKIALLLKFVRSNYIDEVKNGDLYFATLRDFIRIEKQTSKAKWGDINEGKIIYNIDTNDPKISLKIDSVTLTSKDLTGPLTVSIDLSDDELDHTGITCFTMLCQNDFNFIKGKGFKLKSEVFNELKEKMMENNRKLLVIENLEVFRPELNKMGMSNGAVSYYNPEKPLRQREYEIIKQYHKLIPYYKEAKFSYQREFRIAQTIDKPCNIHIPYLKQIISEKDMEWLKTSFFHF